MSVPMKKHLINRVDGMVIMKHAGAVYRFPIKLAEKYRLDDDVSDEDDLFASINDKYTKPGALLRGLRIRENLTQVAMAKKLKLTQSDISQMENGVRAIGRKVAKRIEKLFDVHYRAFLD